MTRDNRDRLGTFGIVLPVRRLALNMAQVEEHNPPPNPAKTTDSRFRGYVHEYGDQSWELDALEPKLIADLIEENVVDLMDEEIYQDRVAEMEETREAFSALSDRWGEVTEFLGYDDPNK